MAEKRLTYIWATGPLGNRARFDSTDRVPVGWIIDGHKEPLHKRTRPEASEPPKAKK